MNIEPLEDFLAVQRFVARKFPWAKKVKLYPCPRAEKDNQERRRTVAHSGHKSNTICYAGRLFLLPRYMRVGILLHEFGHLGGGHEEPDADTWVLKHLDVEIRYAGRDELESITAEDLGRVLCS
jgi:hypothetical protein